MPLIFSTAVCWRQPLRTVTLLIALLPLLAGCASFAPTPSPGAPQPARAYYDTIALGGRLSVRYQQNGKEEALHGSFSWAQTPDQTHVVLLSPLGQTIAAIDVTAADATLTQANQPPRVAADVDTLATQALGWPLPVAGLRHWLQGFTVGADGQRLAVPTTTEATLERDGWRIQYASWQDATGAAVRRPKRIDLERNTASAGPVAIRIVIDDWQVPHNETQ